MAQGPDPRRSRGTQGIRLDHSAYTVGWICSLPCEVAAAEAMFDAFHETLPNPPYDSNVYVLGSISGHNVVVTTLPIGIYGTTSATAVAIRMISTFRSISIPLLVGVGGGVPVNNIRPDIGVPINDIRLGDVVVNIPAPGRHAVVQYDYGKTLESGTMQLTGHLNKPASQLLAAVNCFRARYQSQPLCIPEIMRLAMSGEFRLDDSYVYPGSDKDVLYSNDCSHGAQTRECEVCELKPVERSRRLNDGPYVHYGTVASGNQVIKSSGVRDKLASVLGNLCFEMEAAGIMDHFPALVIRGICDYCDKYKNKSFQKYAALAAAAFTKELLSMVPQMTTTTLCENVIEPRNETIIRKLNFGEAHSRLLTIKDAHPSTLGWFLQHKTYLSWLNDSQFPVHQGFLWIKAKPGAGKSTLMKYILLQIKRTATFTISFFFIARGTELQRTTMGMYRSLLYQLLRHFPELQYSLELILLEEQLDNLDVLKSLFKEAIKHVCKPLTCFIDALDESPEEEIRDLLEELESINENSAQQPFTQQSFRVCCSSRYYPNISIRAGYNLYLDKEIGHTADITNYIDAKLRIGDSKQARGIKAEVTGKSGGVFLWVVLVVQILRREYDRGRMHALQAKLKDTPSEINELIRDILLRDKEDLQELVFSIQWVLYSNRPLGLDEFYYAILASGEEHGMAQRRQPEITLDDMERFVTSSSKGLLEKTEGYNPSVQFIHETVKAFLLHGTLTDVWSGFEAVSEDHCQNQLAQRCFYYLRSAISSTLSIPDAPKHKKDKIAHLRKTYPLYEYAGSYFLHHAEAAEKMGISQLVLLETISKLGSRDFEDLFLLQETRHPSFFDDLLSVLVANNLPLLLRRYLASRFSSEAEKNISVESRDQLLRYSMINKYDHIVELLLEPAPGRGVQVEQYHQAITKTHKLTGNTFLECLVSDPTHELARYLLKSKEWLKDQNHVWIKKLIVGCATHQLISARKLLHKTEFDESEDSDSEPFSISEDQIDCSEASLQKLLLAAVYTNNLFILHCLLYLKVDPNSRDLTNRTPLHVAVMMGHTQIVARLAQIADLEAIDMTGQSPLALAILYRRNDIASFLVRCGASIGAARISEPNDLGPIEGFFNNEINLIHAAKEDMWFKGSVFVQH